VGPAWSQSAQAPLKLTLERCLELALQQSHTYRGAVAQIEQARGSYVGSYANILPNISANAGKSQSTLGSGTAGVIDGVPQVAFTQYGMSGSISQSLLDLQRWYAFRQSRRSWAAARMGLAATEQEIAIDIAGRYFLVVTSERTLVLRRETLQLSEDQLRRTQALFDLGAVTKADVLESRVAVSRAKRDLIDAENAQVVARGRLNLGIGLAQETPIEVEHAAFEIPGDLPTPDQALADARRSRPDLEQLVLELEAAKLGKRSAWWGVMPSLGGSLSYSKGTDRFQDTFDFNDLKGDGSRWSYEIGLSIPIFDGLVTKGQKIRAAGSVRAAEEALAQKELEVGLEVREALLDIERAKVSLDVSKEEIASAEENLRLREAMYDQGAATILELISARVDRTTARAAAISNETSLQLAWYNYLRAMGVRLFKDPRE
jgi:outer membrane protein TolC